MRFQFARIAITLFVAAHCIGAAAAQNEVPPPAEVVGRVGNAWVNDLVLPGLQGRRGAAKEKLLHAGSGNDETEMGIALGLMWLAKQQDIRDGGWKFDGRLKNDRIAATGLALLPFLGAGVTDRTGKKYRDTVTNGMHFLTARQSKNGDFGEHVLIDSHALATLALCEAAGMTRDARLIHSAKIAIDYLVAAQAKNGSWGYASSHEGNLLISGWIIQALHSAALANLPVPDETLRRAAEFVERTSPQPPTIHSPRDRQVDRTALAVALHCRQILGESPRHPSFAKGADWLLHAHSPTDDGFDVYYLYHATQLMFAINGPAWHRDWNPTMRKLAIKRQITARTPDALASHVGSWSKDDNPFASSCGRLGVTALTCLTLEVYYRYLLPKLDDNEQVNRGKGN